VRRIVPGWFIIGIFVMLVNLAACSAPTEKNAPTPPANPVQNDSMLATPTLHQAAGGAAPDAMVAATTPSPFITITHTIQSGETLLEIALNYGVDLDTLAQINGLADPGRISAGDTLAVPLPRPTATVDPAAPTATFPPPPGQVNTIAYDTILQMSPEVRQHMREVYAAGQAAGQNARAFSKVGDSTIENPFFLARFDGSPYNLGDYVYLKTTLDHFAGSFARDSVAVRQGMHSWTMSDTTWADKAVCLANETPLACELRLHRPAVLLVRLGANDAGVPDLFRRSMQEIITFALDNDVIPVLGTKADRHEGSNENNEMIRALAQENRIPLWDFDAVANTIPGRGLDTDNVHLTTFYSHDYTQPEAFQSGHAVHNLTALIVLDRIRTEIMQ